MIGKDYLRDMDWYIDKSIQIQLALAAIDYIKAEMQPPEPEPKVIQAAGSSVLEDNSHRGGLRIHCTNCGHGSDPESPTYLNGPSLREIGDGGGRIRLMHLHEKECPACEQPALEERI